jgi:hypothetical protein
MPTQQEELDQKQVEKLLLFFQVLSTQERISKVINILTNIIIGYLFSLANTVQY